MDGVASGVSAGITVVPAGPTVSQSVAAALSAGTAGVQTILTVQARDEFGNVVSSVDPTTTMLTLDVMRDDGTRVPEVRTGCAFVGGDGFECTLVSEIAGEYLVSALLQVACCDPLPIPGSPFAWRVDPAAFSATMRFVILSLSARLSASSS